MNAESKTPMAYQLRIQVRLGQLTEAGLLKEFEKIETELAEAKEKEQQWASVCQSNLEERDSLRAELERSKADNEKHLTRIQMVEEYKINEQLREQLTQARAEIVVKDEALKRILPEWHSEAGDQSNPDGRVAGEFTWGDLRALKKALKTTTPNK